MKGKQYFVIPVTIDCDSNTANVGGTLMHLRPDMRIKEDAMAIDILVTAIKSEIEKQAIREIYEQKKT